ncbi:MAG: aminotransferase class V-fold PLP-dependent enzyme [Polyangiaceae bacterium]
MSFTLDPSVTFLNHGSFGAVPRPVREHAAALRERQERDPVHFFLDELEPLLDETRASVAELVGARASDLVLVPNATTGANTVLASLAFFPGDEILVTNHGYNAVSNAARRWAARSGARVVVANIPFPIGDASLVLPAILGQISPRTRLAIIDHVTSPTGLVLPIDAIVRALDDRGIDVLVDGAHGPGMLPLALDELGAAYYTGNFHKWICAPRGAAFLHVRRDRQALVQPLVTSHGFNSRRATRSRYLIEADWTGTVDPTSILSVPAAISFLNSQPGGLNAVMAKNRALALSARRTLAAALGATLPCPDDMVGSLAAVPLPDATGEPPAPRFLYADPLHNALYERHHIQVPILSFPRWPHRYVRVSAHLYNEPAHYEALARALLTELSKNEKI